VPITAAYISMCVARVFQLNTVSLGSAAANAQSGATSSSTAVMAAVVNRLQQQTTNYNESEGRRTARRIDQLSRRLFPAAFLAFNVAYWTVYAAVDNPL